MFKSGTTVMIIGNSNDHGFELGEEVVVCGFHPVYIAEDRNFVNVYRCYSPLAMCNGPCDRDYWYVREYDMAI